MSTWASRLSSSLPTTIPYVRRQVRVVSTDAQIKARQNELAVFLNSVQSGGRIPTRKLLTHVGRTPMVLYVFADAYNWPTLHYRGMVHNLKELHTYGRQNALRWWHGYCPERNMLVQFERKSASALIVSELDDAYLVKTHVYSS